MFINFKAKDKHVHVNLLENVQKEGLINTPPQVQIAKSDKIYKRQLICQGRGRIEKFAVLSFGKENERYVWFHDFFD